MSKSKYNSYTREFKLSVAKQHSLGMSSYELEREHGIRASTIRYWALVYRIHGNSSFLSATYSVEKKYEIIQAMLVNNWSLNHASAVYNLISPQTLCRWLAYYKANGIQGLEPKQGRKNLMKKPELSISNKPISEMTEKEVRRELEYLRAENAVQKKLQEWAEQKAAQQKKKQK